MLMLRMFSCSMLGLRIFACLERLSRFARQSGTLVQIRIRLRLFRLSTFSFVLFRHVLIRRLCLFLVVCSFHSKSNNLRLPTRFELLFESTRHSGLSRRATHSCSLRALFASHHPPLRPPLWTHAPIVISACDALQMRQYASLRSAMSVR